MEVHTLRNLANATEPSICGGDAALLSITLTTCSIFHIIPKNDTNLHFCALNATTKTICEVLIQDENTASRDITTRYGDGEGNPVGENSSIFSLIRMC